MALSWIALYPHWYIRERAELGRHYPGFLVDEERLSRGELRLYGDLVVRPPGGAKHHPVRLDYQEGTPYEHPYVTPLEALPRWGKDGTPLSVPQPQLFDHRHQMSGGNLCLFQRETRATPGGDILTGVDILRRAERWFLGLHTGRWPPDTAQSELEAHFQRVADVLVEEVFFDADLVGHGRLYFIRDYQRQFETKEQVPPLILSALSVEGLLIRTVDARAALSRVYPWIGEVAWDATRLAAIEDVASNGPDFMEHGYWWSLPAEPKPFRDGKGLLAVLSSAAGGEDAWPLLSTQLGSDLSLQSRHFVGLKYPARDGGVEWLMLVVVQDMKRPAGAVILKSEAEKRRVFEGSPVLVIRVQRLQPEVLRLRNRGVIDNVVTQKTVALIGLGALGSEVAELLAKAGVGHFRLCDLDYLSIGNVVRHVAGIRDFGTRKTRAVMRRLLEINPYLTFAQEDILEVSAVSSLDALARFMESADLVICTTADESVESVVNQVAVLHRKPVLYGRSLRRASMGRVFLVRPGQDACKACLAHYATASRHGQEVPGDWIDVREDEDGVLLHECGRPVIAGSAIDLSFIAALIARVALDFLEGKAGEANHWLWSRLAAGDVDPRLSQAMATFAGQVPAHSGCAVCQEPEVAELVMVEEVREAMVSLAEASPNVETGGVLIGFVDGQRRAVALRATEPGPNAERTATRFRRDVAYTQSELDRATRELGARGVYIGEWHSHRTVELEPSAIDVDSLFGISESVNYLTRCPVMAIVGLAPATAKVASLGSWVFPVSGRMYRIPNRTISAEVASTYPEQATD